MEASKETDALAVDALADDALAVDACVAILRYMHAVRFGAESVGGADRGYIDVHHLASWYNQQPEELARAIMGDERETRGCMTYENFHKQICRVRRY
jgi:hypothetical protein